MTDDEQRRRIIREARETVERVSRIIPRDETAQQEPSINKLDQWRRGVEAQEAQFAATRAARKASEDRARDDGAAWTQWVADQIAAATLHCARTLAETLRDELDARDATINKMRGEMHRLEAEHLKLLTRVIKNEIDTDDRATAIDMPNPLPRRKEGLN
jgi:hypothetical protein